MKLTTMYNSLFHHLKIILFIYLYIDVHSIWETLISNFRWEVEVVVSKVNSRTAWFDSPFPKSRYTKNTKKWLKKGINLPIEKNYSTMLSAIFPTNSWCWISSSILQIEKSPFKCQIMYKWILKISVYWTKETIIGWPDICRLNRHKMFPFVQYSLFSNIHLYMIWHLVCR